MKNPTFNILTDPWIKAEHLDGTHGRLGIAASIDRSKEIRRLVPPDPATSIGLHRLLLAVVHDQLELETDEEWFELWDRGRLQIDLSAIAGRFDLFDETYPFWERSQRIGALERGFSSPTRSLIIVVFRHTRRKGNDYAQAQTQPTATVREDPTATAGSPRGDPGRDPGRPAGDRNQTPRWARDPHRRRLQVLGARDRGTDRPTVGPPDGRGDASRSRRLGEPAPGPLLGSRGGSHDQGSRPTRRHAPDDVRPGHRPGDLLQPQL